MVYYSAKIIVRIEEKSIIYRTNRYSSVLNGLSPFGYVTWHGVWPPGWIEANRRLYDYELVLVADGKGWVGTETEIFYLERRSLLIIPPYLLHYTGAETKMERWCLHFDWFGSCQAQTTLVAPYIFNDEIQHWNEDLVALPPPAALELNFPIHLRLTDHQFEQMLELLREYFSLIIDSVPSAIRKRILLWQILVFIFNPPQIAKVSKKENVNRLFFQAKSQIDQEFADSGLEVKWIAESLHITPNHLFKLFHREMGMSTKEYLQLRRFDHARNLLRGTRQSISEIADASGFSDGNYFARSFRRKYGISPHEFRSSFQSQ